MSPITHFLAGWVLVEAFTTDRRARIHIALAGAAPDLDGLGAIVDVGNRLLGRPESDWFATHHHVLFHGVFGAVLAVAVSAMLNNRQGRALFLVFLSFHLHLLCDVFGSRGPDGIWPIHYLAPFSQAWSISWSGQWALNAWPNMLITATLMLWAVSRAVTRGESPVAVFSQRADAIVVQTFRTRWQQLRGGANSSAKKDD